MEAITTIRIKKTTRNQLAIFGGKDDTFDDIIIRLMEAYKNDKHKSAESNQQAGQGTKDI